MVQPGRGALLNSGMENATRRVWLLYVVLFGALTGGVGWAQPSTAVGTEAWTMPGPDDPDRWDVDNLEHVQAVRVAGTRLYVRPPFYYVAMDDAAGYEHENKEVEILITEMRTGARLAIDGWMTPESVSNRGIRETNRENLIVNMLPGLLVQGRWDQDPAGREGVLFAVVGTDEASVMMVARYHPFNEREARNAVVWLLSGSIWRSDLELSPLAPMSFRFDIPDGWEVQGRMRSDVAVRPRMNAEAEDDSAVGPPVWHDLAHPDSARIDVYARPLMRPLQEFEQYTRQLAERSTALEDMQIESSEVFPQDDITACLLRGSARYTQTGESVAFVILALYESNRRYVIEGWVHEEDAPEYVERLVDVATSLHRLRQSQLEQVEELPTMRVPMPEVPLPEPEVLKPTDGEDTED